VRHTYFIPPIPDYAYAEADKKNAEYRLEVGSSPVNGSDSYANATLFKDFIPSYTMVNPTFYFGFHDEGCMDAYGVPDSSTFLKAFLGLWHDEKELFRLNQEVHSADGERVVTNCFHEIFGTYTGRLLEGNIYTIEYGFSVSEHEAHTDFNSGYYRIRAFWLILAGNYNLMILAEDQDANPLTTGDVYIDDELVGYTGSTFIVGLGIYKVWVNDFWESGETGYRYGFKNWTDGSVDNPRNITVLETQQSQLISTGSIVQET